MSPRWSLTTKVLPLRIFTISSLITRSSCPAVGSHPRGGSGKIRWIANKSSRSPWHASAPRSTAAIAFVAAGHDLVEHRTFAADGAVGRARLVRHGELALVDGHEPRVVCAPSTRSNRTRPETFRNKGRCARRPSSSKNVAAGPPPAAFREVDAIRPSPPASRNWNNRAARQTESVDSPVLRGRLPRRNPRWKWIRPGRPHPSSFPPCLTSEWSNQDGCMPVGGS